MRIIRVRIVLRKFAVLDYFRSPTLHSASKILRIFPLRRVMIERSLLLYPLKRPCLGLLAVRNHFTPFLFFYRKTATPLGYSQGRAGFVSLTRRTCQNPQKKTTCVAKLKEKGNYGETLIHS